MSKKKKIVISIVIIVVILILIIVLVAKAIASVGKNVNFANAGVVTEVLSKQDMSSSVSAVGTVESQNVLSVTTDLTCKVKELKVALGDYVEVGQVLCVFDDTDIQNQINTLKKQVSTSEALAAKQSQIAQRQLSDAKSNQTTTLNNKLSEIANITNQLNATQASYNAEIDDTKKATYALQIADLQLQLNTANAEYAQLQQSTTEAIQLAQDTVETNALSTTSDSTTTKELADLYRKLDGVIVKAEQSGIVTSLNISQGSIPNGVLMEIQDDKNLQVSVNINESDISKLAKGMSAVITADALEGKKVNGSISRVINFTSSSSSSSSSLMEGSSSSSSSNGYSADITVDSDSGLLLGMSVKVEIIVNEVGEEIAVSYDSIVTDEDGSTYVYKADDLGDGTYKVVKVNVEVGYESDYYTAITSEDLELGNLIICAPDMVVEGDIIIVMDVSGAISQGLEGSSGDAGTVTK